jgi:surfactin synthase thioesterase subunit
MRLTSFSTGLALILVIYPSFFFSFVLIFLLLFFSIRHSFGGFVAWICGGRLQAKKSHLTLKHLFVGGQQAPNIRKELDVVYSDMSFADFKKQLVEWGMMTEENAQDIEDMIMAPSKGEFAADQNFDFDKMKEVPPLLECPITAWYEAEDETFVTVEQVEPWEQFSVRKDEFECLPIYGPHLFLLEEHNESELCDAILEYVRKYV